MLTNVTLSSTDIPITKSDVLPRSLGDDVGVATATATSTLSDDDASDDGVWCPIPVRGVLSKWTNLLHGWQERYFVLSEGTLTYYRNEEEISLGSRGSVRIRTAFVKPHEYDDCRFEVRVGDLIWYLRGVNSSQRQSWIAAIERHRVAESGYGSERTLNRPSSLVSLNSGHSPSLSSSSSFKRGHRLREKLAEMETFKDILCKQVDSLQAYFDTCSLLMDQIVPDRIEDWLKNDHSHSEESFEDRDSCRVGPTSTDAYPFLMDETLSNRNVDLNSIHSTNRHDLSPYPGTDGDGTQHTRNPYQYCNGTSAAPEEVSQPDQTANPPSTIVTPTPNTSTSFFSRFLPSFRFAITKAMGSGNAQPAPDAKAEPVESPGTHRTCDLQRILKQHGSCAPDFRGESHMFKATTTGILTNLSHTIELMLQQEEQWRKRLDRETERRRRLEETQRAMAQEMAHLRHLLGFSSGSRPYSHLPQSLFFTNPHPPTTHHMRLQSCGQLDLNRLHSVPDIPPEPLHKPLGENRALLNLVGPDFQEGPNSLIREEEFYDAIDAESDKIEQDAARLAALRSVGKLLLSAKSMPSTHPLYAEVEQCVLERERNFANPKAFDPTSCYSSVPSPDGESAAAEDWQVIAQEGEMIVYKREIETEDGVVLDPLQAVHVVHGVTAREMCTYFWDVQYRMDWEFTIDQAPTILEVCGDDTVVLHQVYKRVWPTTQRESLFWSHIRHIGSTADPSTVNTDGVLDSWMVVNMSTNYLAEKVACSSTPMIRLGLDVVFFCQTVVDPALCSVATPIDRTALTRDQVRTRLVYVANINPGGWVPAAGLRSLARREYPRFLKRFSAYVQEQTREKPLLF